MLHNICRRKSQLLTPSSGPHLLVSTPCHFPSSLCFRDVQEHTQLVPLRALAFAFFFIFSNSECSIFTYPVPPVPQVSPQRFLTILSRVSHPRYYHLSLFQLLPSLTATHNRPIHVLSFRCVSCLSELNVSSVDPACSLLCL